MAIEAGEFSGSTVVPNPNPDWVEPCRKTYKFDLSSKEELVSLYLGGQITFSAYIARCEWAGHDRKKRINWYQFEQQLREQFATVVPEQRAHGLGDQSLKATIAAAVQTAKNLHRGSPTGAVGSQLLWAESVEDLRRQLVRKGFDELFPEEEELCQKVFARQPQSEYKPLVLVWHYAPDDLELQPSSEWYRQMYSSGGGGGGHGYSSGCSSSGSEGCRH